MAETTPQGLFPAEHRALRELHAAGRHLTHHWGALSRRLGGEQAAVLARGAGAGRELVGELETRTAARGVQGLPSAQGVGSRLGSARDVGDLLLERNQAMRLAVLDLQHTTTLLAYLVALAESRGDGDLAGWERSWQQRLAAIEGDARGAAAALGRDPDGAIEPAEPSALGRAGHGLAARLGALGEQIDNSAPGRAVRRLMSGG